MLRRTRSSALTALLISGLAHAQGTSDYLNFETPIQQALAIVNVNGTDYLLACNAQDAAVEVYTTPAPPAMPVFLLRVPVGQEPVSVAVKPTPLAGGARRCYTANWLGDSVTSFDVSATGNPNAPLGFKLNRSVTVGNEPMRIAFLPAFDSWAPAGSPLHESLLVTLGERGQWVWLMPETLSYVQNPATGQLLGPFELMDPAQKRAVKDARGIAFSPASSDLFILNFRGGNDGGAYDYDLWGTSNVITSVALNQGTYGPIGNLGTTNFTMSFAPNGDLYVVSINARNLDPLLLPNPVIAVGEPIHRQMTTNGTGFVESRLVRLSGLGSSNLVTEIRDLNDLTGVSGTQSSTPVSQPTDVIVYGSGAPGQTRVFTTGFNSDTIAMVEPLAPPANPPSVAKVGWATARIALWAPGTGFSLTNLSGPMHGPRAFAIKKSGIQNDPTDLLYVYNRVSHSVSILDPNFNAANPPAAVLGNFTLQRDPSPAHVRNGRKFLYSAELSAGRNVSCASCHIDGGSDFLPWNLADNGAIPAPGSPNSLPGSLGPNAANKGPMVTQSLRGLVNFEVADDAVQDVLFSNRPYHWRGDKGTFEDFNAAFVNLLGLPNINVGAPTPAFNKGIPPTPAMHDFRDFVFSMHLSPNPEQRWDRQYSGDIGAPNNNTDGSGASRGLELYMTQPSTGQLACVNCHTLPDGSNNRFTETFPFNGQPLAAQNIETAQMKALTLKETKLMRYDPLVGALTLLPNATTPALTAEFGGVHTGQDSTIPLFSSRSIRDFIACFPVTSADRDDLTRFTREFDSGVAPLVGRTDTGLWGDYSGPGSGADIHLGRLESQAYAGNVGLAVHAVINGQLHGYWLDVRDSVTPYHEISGASNPTGNLSRLGLLSLIDVTIPTNAGNLVTGHCTPLGCERRIAWLGTGTPPPPTATTPSGVTLQPCQPNTASFLIPKFTANWIASLLAILATLPTQSLDVDDNLAVGIFQLSLLTYGGTGAFGLPQMRHEAPRRLRLSGQNIEPGAVLRLFAPLATDVAPPGSPPAQPTSTPTIADHPSIQVPIYPTTVLNAIVWETAVEVEPLVLYTMMHGGFANPGVITTLVAPRTVNLTTNVIDPQRWNWWYVEVQNDVNNPATTSAGSWQRLTVN